MNKFKLPSSSVQPHHRKTQPQKQQRRDQVHLLSILDKCTQILRDDRIWLRNRVKQMDPDILAVFRKSLKRVTASRVSEVELQTLQINLRKYVTRVKDRHKQEQLTRFKENLCSANCLCEHKANGGGNHRQQQQLWERRREEDSIEEQENSRYSHQQQQSSQQQPSDNTFSNLFKNKKKNLFDTLKLNEPIEQQSETQKQLSSYRSRSEEPYGRANYHEEKHQEEERWINQSGSGKKPVIEGYTPPKVTSPEDGYSKNWSIHNKGVVDSEEVHYQGRSLAYQNMSDEKKHKLERSQAKVVNEGSTKKEENAYRVVKEQVSSQITTNVVQVKQQKKYTEQRKQTSSSVSYTQQPSWSYKFDTVSSNSFQPPTYQLQPQPHSSYFSSLNPPPTATFSSQKLLDIPKPTLPVPVIQTQTPAFPEFKPYDFSSKASFTSDYSSKATFTLPKQTTDDENLFTSPELLMECRKILEKSAEKKSTMFERVPVEGYGASLMGLQVPMGNGVSLGSLPVTASSGTFPTISELASKVNGAASVASLSYGLNYSNTASSAILKTTTTTTLVNNYTAKQVASTETLIETKAIAQKSPYKFPTVVDTYKESSHTKTVSILSEDHNKKSGAFDRFSAKDCSSETKNEQLKVYPQNKPPSQKPNALTTLLVAQSFQRQSDQQYQSHALASIQKLSGQQVFDIFFFQQTSSANSIPPHTIHSSQFFKIAKENFQDINKFEKIFEMCSVGSVVNALDFGKALDKVLGKEKAGQLDPIREIFGLIDIKQKGFFNLDDYQKFLEQVLESEQENYEQVDTLAYRLFELADVNDLKKVEYWGLYLTKQTEQFQNFSEYLGQFEFEVEM